MMRTHEMAMPCEYCGGTDGWICECQIALLQIYTKVNRAGDAQAWAYIGGRRYPIQAALADVLIETGLAVHNPDLAVKVKALVRER